MKFFRRRKSRRERIADRIQDLAQKARSVGLDDAEASDDSFWISFLGGLLFGVTLGILVALILNALNAEHQGEQTRPTGITLLPNRANHDSNPAVSR